MCLSIAVNHPEKVLATGNYLDYQWVVVRNHMGFRCGYVRVPKGHPWHGQHYDNIDVSCHGGLTFAEMDVPCDAPGEDDAYWVGFDCAHSGDAPDPNLTNNEEYLRLFVGTVRSQEYAEEQCRRICEQAAEVYKDVQVSDVQETCKRQM